jgi:hypothetical protein
MVTELFFGCATCLIDKDSPTFVASQGAIGFLLVVINSMLLLLGWVIYRFARRARLNAVAQAAVAHS